MFLHTEREDVEDVREKSCILGGVWNEGRKGGEEKMRGSKIKPHTGNAVLMYVYTT